jgi:hypothetical protein
MAYLFLVRRMKTLIVASSLVLCLLRCNAQTNASESVELLGFGIFKKITTLDSGTLSLAGRGVSRASDKRHAVPAALVEFTTKVPAQIGTSFGFRVAYHGQNAGALVHCTAKCLHPKLTDPASGRSSEVEQFDASSVSGREEYVGYTLDKAWKLVPGEWKMQLWVGSKLMVEKTFILYAPSA